MAETNSKSSKTPAKSSSKSSSRVSRAKQQQTMLTDGLSFAASEAYKLLRTNLLFSLPDKPCRVIGVTSSIRGEGKSTTSVNLSFTFAQTGKRVLLIDGDMRLPSVASKLEIRTAPGLSNLLAGLNREQDCLRKSAQLDNWFILPAGDIPPNPSELLGSERMHALLERYSEIFDYIILDLPPVNIVVDALVISKWTDGLIMTVRENYTDRKALDSCMYQIKKLEAKVLGFVMTDASVGESSYKHYGKYGKKYGYGYGYDYADSGKPRTSSRKTKAFLDVTLDENSESFDPSAPSAPATPEVPAETGEHVKSE